MESPEGRTQAVPFGNGYGVHAAAEAETCGVAQSARGPIVAGWCPHPTGSGVRFSLPGHGRLKTASGFIRHGLGLALTIRERRVSDQSQTPSPNPQDGPPQARFHPRPDCRPAPAGTRGKGLSGG